MFILISLLLVGISFSPLMLMGLNIWNAQGLYFHFFLMLMLCWSLFQPAKNKEIINKPLSLLLCWITISTSFFVYKLLAKDTILILFRWTEKTKVFFNTDLKMAVGQLEFLRQGVNRLAPFFCILSVFLFYKICVSYLDRQKIEKILKYLKYVLFATLGMCVLQYLGLSQFFSKSPAFPFYQRDQISLVSGFIGNGTHLSTFLAMLSPLLLFERKRENVFILIFLTIILCISGQNINDIPLSGFVILLGVLLYFFKNKIFVITMLTSLGLGIFFFWQKLPQDFFASSGRLNWWAEYYKYFHALPVTGNGLGIVNIVCKLTPFTELRHLHNEPYQILVELGIIGFVLIIWLVHDFFKRVAEDRLELTLKALILGFLVSCCFQYTAHLWLPTILTTFFYASFIVLKEKNYDC